MRIERSVHIARPIGEVFAFVSDPVNDPLWCPKVQAVEQTVGQGAAPGAAYRVRHRPVPVRPARDMTYRLTGWDPPHRIDWHEHDGHDRIAVTYLLRAHDDGTHLTQIDDAELGAPRFLQPLMRAGIGHDVARQLRRLRRHLESPAAPEHPLATPA